VFECYTVTRCLRRSLQYCSSLDLSGLQPNQQPWKFQYFSAAACAASGCVCLQRSLLLMWPAAARASPARACFSSSLYCILQQPVLPLGVSVCSSLCCHWTCLFSSILCTPGHVCQQQLVLHLDVFVYQSMCCTWNVCQHQPTACSPGRACSAAARAVCSPGRVCSTAACTVCSPCRAFSTAACTQ
jgi:hypothetical protein